MPCPPADVTATSASVAHLKVKGVVTVTNFASSTNPNAMKMRCCKSGRPWGQR
jgi:hypothetical protein